MMNQIGIIATLLMATGLTISVVTYFPLIYKGYFIELPQLLKKESFFIANELKKISKRKQVQKEFWSKYESPERAEKYTALFNHKERKSEKGGFLKVRWEKCRRCQSNRVVHKGQVGCFIVGFILLVNMIIFSFLVDFFQSNYLLGLSIVAQILIIIGLSILVSLFIAKAITRLNQHLFCSDCKYVWTPK